MTSARPAWRAAGSARSSASGATSSARAPASASSCSISRSVNSGLTVTTTAPARHTACAATAKAGELGPHTATTSPGWTPRPSSPPASASTVLVSSPKVRLSPVTPSISAVLLGRRRPRSSTNELKSRFGRLRSGSGLRTIMAVLPSVSIDSRVIDCQYLTYSREHARRGHRESAENDRISVYTREHACPSVPTALHAQASARS